MKTYLCKAETGHNELKVNAYNAKIAFLGVCCWFDNNVKITITDAETGEKRTFSRTFDKAGNFTGLIEY